MKNELLYKSVYELSGLLESGAVSSVELTRAYLDSIAASEPEIGAFITVTDNLALDCAAGIDRRRHNGEKLSPLAGIPGALKDNICTRGVKTTCASKMLESFIPPYDAAVAEKLDAAGYVPLGKLNMDEFAMGSTTENSAFHTTKNPRDTSRVPGGSSGGSAAAVAAFEAPFALGSDTGGSIRQPASFCGVVGIKPTYGLVSRWGLIAFASSLDQIGTLTRSVRDGAMVLSAIAGHDPRDATSADVGGQDFDGRLGSDIKGVKIGVVSQMNAAGLSADVRETLDGTLGLLESLGAETVEVSMPSLDAALSAYYVVSSAEASSNLARFDGVRYGRRAQKYDDIDSLYRNSRSEGFGAEVKRRILLGSFALSSGYYDAYYNKALAVRSKLIAQFAEIFGRCDVILAPTAPTAAYKLGEKRGDPVEMYLGDVCTVPVNLAGLPALTLPCAVNREGLPVGLQLIGRAFGEAELMKIAYSLESSLSLGLDKGGKQQ